MPNTLQIINPTLEKNMNLTVELMRSIHGENPGHLIPYEVYILPNIDGEPIKYVLTHGVIQFVADPLMLSDAPPIRLDVIELTFESKGHYGCILPVIQSIIFNNGQPVFDTTGNYVVKLIFFDPEEPTDKADKPNYSIRAAYREHYLASNMPRLGAYYRLVHGSSSSYLHMNRAPGLPLQSYFNKLDAESFLKLACALLEQVPQQMQEIIRSGKHAGKRIVHRDLKPQNILAEYKDHNWIITVIDMGLAKALPGEHYTTERPRGNLMVLDRLMFKAIQNHQPITYSSQTDLYALYMIIFTLAGASYRYNLKSISALAKDIEHPNFHGLFYSMILDAPIRTKLQELFERILGSNSDEMPSLDEVLTSFQEALLAHQSKAVHDVCELHPASLPPVTAEMLKSSLEENLDYTIGEQVFLGNKPTATLMSWISRHHALLARASAEELERFKSLLTIPDHIKISSHYILNLLRFNLIDECDDNACVRLISRHHECLKPVKKSLSHNKHKLPAEWFTLFTHILNEFPLQLTIEQEQFCIKFSKLIKNTAIILNLNLEPTISPIIQTLKATLDSCFVMEPAERGKKLSVWVEQVNAQFHCLEQIAEILSKYKTTRHWNDQWQKKTEEWIHYFNEHQLSEAGTRDLSPYFAARSTLATQLARISENQLHLRSLFVQYPSLKQSPYSMDALNESIRTLRIQDDHDVSHLIQKTHILFLLFNLHVVFSNSDHPLKQHNDIYEHCFNQFKAQIEHYSILDEFLLKNLFIYLCAIEKLLHFIDRLHRYGTYQVIEQVLTHLMTDQKLIGDLNKLLLKGINLVHLKKLNFGLETLLSQPKQDHLNQRLFTEIAQYYASPENYRPYSPPVAASSSSFGMFPIQKIADYSISAIELQL
ncbi:protein kinase domain-containing protein [Legionella bononiensis]|uniref:Serine/threonine protein kinase n=1 Tax=Legionella bononiensis TaxID=2793102 RepID=A0ABS1WA55_9GAMM|nr:serine/threonine-protein kinase [Legionella bononiensis]MBL7480520.1 serine/threonine protein kinase [Legionella bononiensis]MBL7526241.1 serine/threonine protein kinase [Legionella bononiensis]MBL7563264.1 serine/threonine protein kinase [Legionella bononiensis]